MAPPSRFRHRKTFHRPTTEKDEIKHGQVTRQYWRELNNKVKEQRAISRLQYEELDARSREIESKDRDFWRDFKEFTEYMACGGTSCFETLRQRTVSRMTPEQYRLALDIGLEKRQFEQEYGDWMRFDAEIEELADQADRVKLLLDDMKKKKSSADSVEKENEKNRKEKKGMSGGEEACNPFESIDEHFQEHERRQMLEQSAPTAPPKSSLDDLDVADPAADADAGHTDDHSNDLDTITGSSNKQRERKAIKQRENRRRQKEKLALNTETETEAENTKLPNDRDDDTTNTDESKQTTSCNFAEDLVDKYKADKPAAFCREYDVPSDEGEKEEDTRFAYSARWRHRRHYGDIPTFTRTRYMPGDDTDALPSASDCQTMKKEMPKPLLPDAEQQAAKAEGEGTEPASSASPDLASLLPEDGEWDLD